MENNQPSKSPTKAPVETPVKTPNPTKNPSKIDIPKPNEKEKGKPKA
jgi:hypothetical protein